MMATKGNGYRLGGSTTVVVSETKEQQMQKRQEKEKQKYEKEKQGLKEGAGPKEVAVEKIWDPDELFLLLLQEDVIPMKAVTEWYDLGIELDIDPDKLDAIKKDVAKDSVGPITMKMLRDWCQRTGGLAGELITAIDKAGLVAYAATLMKDFDPDKKLTYQDLKEIVPNIACHWNDVGIQLNIKHLDNYQITNLTEERFKEMLKFWLNINAKGPKELCDVFHKALKKNQWNRAAGEFETKYKKFFELKKLN